MLLGVETEGKLVVPLELSYLLQPLALYKLADGAAVGYFEEVGLKVAVGETEVEELLGVLLHLLQFQLDELLKVLADVGAESHGGSVGDHFDVVFDLVIFIFFEEADCELFSLLHISYTTIINCIPAILQHTATYHPLLNIPTHLSQSKNTDFSSNHLGRLYN